VFFPYIVTTHFPRKNTHKKFSEFQNRRTIHESYESGEQSTSSDELKTMTEVKYKQKFRL
jgi:hypothetical protein